MNSTDANSKLSPSLKPLLTRFHSVLCASSTSCSFARSFSQRKSEDLTVRVVTLEKDLKTLQHPFTAIELFMEEFENNYKEINVDSENVERWCSKEISFILMGRIKVHD
ncbi:uncharacterized protein [Phaseolus vulgaris]|uniref:uncharacterized protein isoform X5 n=1 Tax=Phaseolus vulgaris TaxID=3885 RepID=UPI0035CA2BCA